MAIIDDEIKFLEQQIKNIQSRIIFLKKQKTKASPSNKKDNDSLLSSHGFSKYLLDNGLKEHTISNYFGVLRSIKKELKKILGYELDTEIYDIQDKIAVKKIIDLFKENDELQAINRKRHNSLSASLNNYYQYVCSINTNVEFVIEDD